MDGSPLADLSVPLLRIAPRLLVAVLLGGFLGWNRERQAKPAGLRTHMMVTLGSASFVLLAFELGIDFSKDHGGSDLDPTRVLQGVVGGIGFLGAGSIIQSRGHVEGVTTAASVWVCGAVGAAAGLGAYELATLTALLSWLILTTVARLEQRIRPDRPEEPRPSDPEASAPKPVFRRNSHGE